MVVLSQTGPNPGLEPFVPRSSRRPIRAAAPLVVVLAFVALVSAIRSLLTVEATGGRAQGTNGSVHEHVRVEEAWRQELERVQNSHRQDVERLRAAHLAETERLDGVWRRYLQQLHDEHEAATGELHRQHLAATDSLRAQHTQVEQRLETNYRAQLADVSSRVTGMLERLAELESSKQALVQSLGIKPPVNAKPAAPTMVQSARPPQSPAAATASPVPQPVQIKPAARREPVTMATPPRGQGGPMKWPPLLQPHETSLAEQLDDAVHKLSEMDLTLASIQAQWRRDFSRIEQLPIALPLRVDFTISSGFGVRSDPFNGITSMHEGVDLIARHGSPVLATAGGVVTRSGRAGAHGQMVEIRHAEGWVTRYAHLSRRLVQQGDTVGRGDIIGLLGSTGRSSGNHLHYEIEHNGRALDPTRALSSLPWRR